MGALLYVRLIGFTAGTLLMLFWMVVILGYRRQRNFERVLFLLCVALFLFYAGSLLALNAEIFYSQAPARLVEFATVLVCVGLSILPPLTFHLHAEYSETRGQKTSRMAKAFVLPFLYLPAVYFLAFKLPALIASRTFDFLIPGNSLGIIYLGWLFLSLLLSCAWEQSFARRMEAQPEKKFHRVAWIILAIALVFLGMVHFVPWGFSAETKESLATVLALLPLVPFAALIYFVQRHNFLNIGRQKNLLYAVSATFVALLYLALVRRISNWMAPVLPPEATAAILLFALVIFIEPLQRVLGRRLQETAQQEMNRVHRLANEIQLEARKGNLRGLVQFINRRLAEDLQFADAWIQVLQPKLEAVAPPNKKESISFSIYRPGRINAVLGVRPHGAMISGETEVALQFLSESLAGALDVCLVIDEKLQLERELAERERLALVGQTAASISHNLKNPLGSIKTILQVQLENPELPDSLRPETKMVLEEIGRLSAKLNQLLQFSRPAVIGGETSATCEAASVVREAVNVLRPEAERKGIRLELREGANPAIAAISAEALNDVMSNLLVNALEATGPGRNILVTTEGKASLFAIQVEDDGPGIPEKVKEKILQPFFTTKSQGTGLGLAIVAKRVGEFGGTLEWVSPVKDGKGTRFEVKIKAEVME